MDASMSGFLDSGEMMQRSEKSMHTVTLDAAMQRIMHAVRGLRPYKKDDDLMVHEMMQGGSRHECLR